MWLLPDRSHTPEHKLLQHGSFRVEVRLGSQEPASGGRLLPAPPKVGAPAEARGGGL